MILEMEVEAIQASGLGASKAGVSLTLADANRPRCLVPFSAYIRNENDFKDKHGVAPSDLVGKRVLVAVTQMTPEGRGVGIKLDGEVGPKTNGSK